MNVLRRWRLRREIDKEQVKIDKMRRFTPHADFVEITRSQGKIRRLMEELSGIQSNRQQQKGSES